MTKYYVVAFNGFQSSQYFRNRKYAQAAADRRSALSGQSWEVREVWLRDEYADDDRPYKKPNVRG